MRKLTSSLVVLLLIFCYTGIAQIPKIISSNGRHILFVDGKPFFILGGQAHNSSAWPALLPGVWKSAVYMHLNTLEVPIYWEQVEPIEGNFDFSLVDTMLLQARAHQMRLVLLWFSTWKNGSNHYIPSWMKRKPLKYPNITSKDGKQIDSPSPFADAALQADSKAFATIMRHLRQTDTLHTVIMVQVENEPGTWGSVRDYSAKAQHLFDGPVPLTLSKPELLQALKVPVVKNGTWSAVFGQRADEYFHAWYVASFIGKVAEAGKKEYGIPLYVNAALRDPITNPPATEYESGGATDNIIPIWKAAAPSIDVLAPDIYLSGSDRIERVFDLYNRRDNPLLVPEAGLKRTNAKYLYEVLARGGIGFAPFGIDNNGDSSVEEKLNEALAPFAAEYAAAAPLLPQLAQWSHDGKVKSATEADDHKDQIIELGNWRCTVVFGGNGRANAAPVYKEPTGNAMFIQLDENIFLVSGTGCHILFHPQGIFAGKPWQYIKVEEGKYNDGTFIPSRILNGDETDWGGPGFNDTPILLRITLAMR